MKVIIYYSSHSVLLIKGLIWHHKECIQESCQYWKNTMWKTIYENLNQYSDTTDIKCDSKLCAMITAKVKY